MPAQDSAQRRVWLLRALVFAQAWLVVQGRVVAYSWLLEVAGAGQLPWLYVGQALAVGLLTLLLFGTVDRVGRASLLGGMFIVFGLGVAMASAVPHGQGSRAAPAFLLFVEAGIALISGHFWLLAGELLSPDQSRRHFPSFTLAGGLGAIAGGSAGHLAAVLETRGMVLLLIVPALACSGLAMAAHNRYAYRVGPRAKRPKTAFVAQLKDGMAMVDGSSLLRWVGLLTALVVMSGLAIDYLFSLAVVKTASASALPSFLGNTNMAVSVVQLVVVATLGSKLLTSFGLFRTFQSYPVGGAAAVAAGAPFGLAASAVMLKIFDRLENYLVLNPGLGIALAAFPRERRGRASFIYGGLVKPLAMAAMGSALVVSQAAPAALWVLIAVALVAFVPLLRKLATVYRDTLVQNLGTSDRKLITASIEALTERENQTVVPRLLELVEKTSDPILIENVLRAAGGIRDPRFVPALIAGLKNPNSSIKIAAAGSLTHFPGPEVQAALVAAVNDEPSTRVKASLIAALGQEHSALRPVLRAGLTDQEARVRANAVEAIGLSGDAALIGELRPLLESVTPREVANVVVALARVPEHRAAALSALGRVFAGNDRSLLASALWAAGEAGDADHLPLITSYLSDADPMVRRNAIIAMAKLGRAEVVPPMIALLLGPRDDAMAMARAVGRLGSREREEVLIQLTALGSEQRAQALDAFVNCGLNYPEELELLR